MLFKAIDSTRLGDGLFRLFSWLSVVLAAVAVAWTSDWPTALTAVGVNLLFAVVNACQWYRRLPGMIALTAFNILYVQIPITYFSTALATYDFGASTSVPRSNADYATTLNPAIWMFVLAYFAMVLGMRVVWREPASPPAAGWPTRRLSTYSLLLGAVVVALISVNDLTNIFVAQAARDEKAESRLALLFNDRMFQLLFPVLFFALPGRFNRVWRQLQYALGAALFLWVNLFATSKAAVVAVGLSFFIYPVAVYYRRARIVYWPSTLLLTLCIVLSGPLYFIALVDREARLQGRELAVGDIWSEVNSVVGGLDTSVTDVIATRLAVSLNNYVLIVREFDGSQPPGYRAEVATYIYRSMMNMLLPGTPYPEAYSPSSQQFHLVIRHAPLLSTVSKAELLIGANTQPFTLFGVLAMFGGPVFVSLLAAATGAIFASLCRTFTSALNRAVLVFSFVNFYGCYAIESAVQFPVILIITSYCMAALLWAFGALFRINLPAPAVPTEAPA